MGSQGNLSQLVAFPVRTFDGNSVDSAPATVVQGPDGAFYVGELTRYPYYAGAADVWRVVPGQKPTVYASGLSKYIDIAFDPRAGCSSSRPAAGWRPPRSSGSTGTAPRRCS